MLASSIPQNQIKGIRKSLNMASMHQMSERIKNKSFMPPSSPMAPKPKSDVPQITQQKDKPIIRQSGNTHREISRPLDMFSQPLSSNRVAKTKEAESYHKGKDSVTQGESNNVLKAIDMIQSQMVSESGIYNAGNNRKLSISHG